MKPMKWFLPLCLTLMAAGPPPVMAQRQPLPDLDVVAIERTPRYPGYALEYGRPGWKGIPILVGNRTRKPLTPQEARRIQRWPKEGELVTFTAHVRNHGDAPAPPYDFVWMVDGTPVSKGATPESQPAGTERTFSFSWRWKTGRHLVRFIVDPLVKIRDACLTNNSREDATDAWSLLMAVDRETYDAFNRTVNFLGTRSFEDWVQWHIDQMNRLFDLSPSPFGPSSWRPRVRCDKFVVVADASKLWANILGPGVQPLDAGWDGAWGFGRRADCAAWAAAPDWGLIHEWGHQLGLTDEYALDRPGFQNLVKDARGDPLLIGRWSSLRGTMMHGHGPTLFSPECMAALQSQRGRRRGYYGDYYYCIPRVNRLRILDRTGAPVAGATVTFWQDRDGIFQDPPVFFGKTDAHGLFTLPNRRAPHVTTDQGFTLRDNPFGQVNVVGPGDVFFIRIQARAHTEYTWMDITDFNLAYWSGRREAATFLRRTHIPAAGSPPPPSHVWIDTYRDTVHLTWSPVPQARSYRIYDGVSDLFDYRPAGTTRTPRWTGKMHDAGMHRFVVTCVDAAGRESAYSDWAGAMRFIKPWGIALLPDGRAIIRDAAYGQDIVRKADGAILGLMGSVHYHFEGSYDVAADPRGRILSAKWGDGYNPGQGFKIQGSDLQIALERLQPPGRGPGQVQGPMGIASDAAGHIFVADTGNDRIEEFGADGTFLRAVGEGELNQPMKAAFDASGKLYVADSGHNRIAVYARDAEGGFHLERSLTGVKEPVYVQVDREGRVYVSTNRDAGVVVLDRDGRVLWKFQGTPVEPLSGPRGLALDGKGHLLVVDEASQRVLAISLPPELRR
ncbi:MAG: CARDB domain-containing protein [Chthonomonadales bacterium]